MAKSKQDILDERINGLYSTLGDIQEKLENKPLIEQPKVSPIKKHFDALLENAFNSPHTTLSGIAVVGCSIGAKFFPQYASTLSELQVYATGLTGVTAGNAVINKKPIAEVKTVTVPGTQTEEYG